MHLSKTASGFGWTSISTIVNGLTQVLRLSILSRFLTKEDFGVVTIITFILGLTQVFSDLGFSAAIMSEKNLKRNSFNAVYWAQFFFYLLVLLLVCLLSPLIANYYQQTILKILIPISLLELLFMGIGRLYDTLLQKQMRFRIIAIRNIISAFVSLIVAVILAILGFGPYSLVLSTVLHAAILHIWNFVLGQKDYSISLRNLSFSESKGLMKVGFYQMGTQVVDYFGSKIDILIISRFLGLEVLGVYNLVKELVLKIIMIVNTIVNRVMLPTFSASFSSINQLRDSFVAFIKSLSLLNFPLIGFVFVFRYYIITLFYGAQYSDASLIFGIMSLWSVFVVLGNPNGMIAIITQNTKISFIYTVIRLIIMAIVLYIFGRHSLKASALSMLIVYFIMFFVNWKLLLERILLLSLIDYLKCFIRSLSGIVAISYFCNYLLSQDVLRLNNVIIQFFIYAFVYGLFFLCYVVIFEKKQIGFLKNVLLDSEE